MAIKFTYNKQEYILSFNKKTVRKLGANGVTPDVLQTNPLHVVPTLFSAAFEKNHPRVKQNVIDDIYNSIENKEGLIVALVELYNEPIQELFDEPEDDSAKISWELVQD